MGPVLNGIRRRAQLVVAWLAQLPRVGVLLGVLALTVAGLILPGVAGAVVIVLLAILLLCLMIVAWPVLDPGGRLVRMLVLAVLLVAAATKI